MRVLAIAGCTTTVCYAFLVWQAWPTNLLPLGLGVAAGALGAFLSRPAIESACAGDSSSGSRATTVVVLMAIGSTGLVSGGLAQLNGALDDSAGKAWHGVVTSQTASAKSAMAFRWNGVRWDDGSTSRINGNYAVGARLTERRYPGAFGWEWYAARGLSSR